MSAFIYLASQSPRRSQLLSQLGVEHRLLLPDDLEDSEALEAVLPGEAPLDYVQRVTALKLQAAQARLLRRQLPPAPILCSDTTVALGRSILGKPQDAADAAKKAAEDAAAKAQEAAASAQNSVGGGTATPEAAKEAEKAAEKAAEQNGNFLSGLWDQAKNAAEQAQKAAQDAADAGNPKH